MKKVIFIVCLTNISLIAQPDSKMRSDQNVQQTHIQLQNNTQDIPSDITKKFTTNYPDIEATWVKQGDTYKVLYHDEGTKMGRILVYDKTANIIQTDMEINDLSYPQPIGDYYTKNYPNESYKVWVSQDNNGIKKYYTKRNKTDVWFDSKGNYVTTKSSDQ